jgi:hypothetical protein
MADTLTTPQMIRATLERLVGEHGETYAALSRMIRRRDHYLARFVREGVPKRLAASEIAVLAGYFRIDPRLLGGKAPMAARRKQLASSEPKYRSITFREE